MRNVSSQAVFAPPPPVALGSSTLHAFAVFRMTAAAIFSWALLQPDWATLNGTGFIDLENYLEGFDSGWYYWQVMHLDWLRFILSEGIWVTVADSIINIVDDSHFAFYLLGLASLFVMSIYVCNRTRSIWYLWILASPAMIDLAVGELRSAVGGALFYLAIGTRLGPLRIALFVAAIGIHTSYIVFVGIYLSYHAITLFALRGRLFNGRLVWLLAAAIGSAVLAVLQNAVLESVGDRRADIYLYLTSGTMLLAAWGLFGAGLSVADWRRRLSFEAYLFIFACGLFATSNFLGLYGQRWVAVALPSLAVALSKLTPTPRTPLLVAYAAFMLIYYQYYLVIV